MFLALLCGTLTYIVPFGLILKRSERTSQDEAAAMQMARVAGMPISADDFLRRTRQRIWTTYLVHTDDEATWF